MARQYVITEEEFVSLIESLELHRLRSDNVADPYRHLDDAWRELTDKEKKAAMAAIDCMHRGFHFVVVRWVQAMGFKEGRRT